MVGRNLHVSGSGSYPAVGNFELYTSVTRELIIKSIHKVINNLLVETMLICLIRVLLGLHSTREFCFSVNYQYIYALKLI